MVIDDTMAASSQIYRLPQPMGSHVSSFELHFWRQLVDSLEPPQSACNWTDQYCRCRRSEVDVDVDVDVDVAAPSTQ
jgi:hypothetical protein